VLAERIPHATLRIFPHGGHAFSGEFSDGFNAAVLKFLRA
jgi:pimeloyl-ACP methyl ester carboxylesterase